MVLHMHARDKPIIPRQRAGFTRDPTHAVAVVNARRGSRSSLRRGARLSGQYARARIALLPYSNLAPSPSPSPSRLASPLGRQPHPARPRLRGRPPEGALLRTEPKVTRAGMTERRTTFGIMHRIPYVVFPLLLGYKKHHT